MLVMWEYGQNRWDMKMFMVVVIFSAFCFATTSRTKKKPGLIYILEWTTRYKEPFSYMQMKREAFTTRKCRYQNCYLTDNIAYFENITDFDVILFNMANMLPRKEMILPESRTDDQIYIFVSTESASNYPVGPDFNMFFNWTMTYKLDSDIPSPYAAVWNKNGDVIGPAPNITWVKHMAPTSKYIIRKLRHKRIPAAWFVSSCGSSNQRLEFVTKLRNAMAQYGLTLDVYGTCGNKICPRQRIEECYGLLETNYYFYFAFENSFSEDYITEKFLTAAEHYTVPVLYGGANYSRFMPKGMYIDARTLGPQKTAKKMSNVIRNRNLYYKYFRFHNYYVFHAAHDSVTTDPVCNLCDKLNDERLKNERRVYALLTQWWNDVEPGKTLEKPIHYYNTTNDVLWNERPKVYIENPNMYAMKPVEVQDGPLLTQIYNYFFD